MIDTAENRRQLESLEGLDRYAYLAYGHTHGPDCRVGRPYAAHGPPVGQRCLGFLVLAFQERRSLLQFSHSINFKFIAVCVTYSMGGNCVFVLFDVCIFAGL